MMRMVPENQDGVADLSVITIKDYSRITTCIIAMWFAELLIWLDRSVVRVTLVQYTVLIQRKMCNAKTISTVFIEKQMQRLMKSRKMRRF